MLATVSLASYPRRACEATVSCAPDCFSLYVQLLDAGLEESTFDSASPLPLLSPLNLPVSIEMFPRLLFVAEFLNTFASALNLKRQFTARDLCTLLTSGRGIGDVYLQLLQVRFRDACINTECVAMETPI